MELNHSLWRLSADSKPTTDHLSQEKVFNLLISCIVHCGLRLSDVVCIHAGLCEHSRPLRSLTAFLSDLISFSQRHLACSDNHNRFLGEASAAPEEQGGEILRGGGRKRQVWQPWRLLVSGGFLARLRGAAAKHIRDRTLLRDPTAESTCTWQLFPSTNISTAKNTSTEEDPKTSTTSEMPADKEKVQ